jgi:8-oxo-dGTP pyrophosphatase MutT (NUDIX family)
VSHAGTALLRELAAETGLAAGVTGALLDTYQGFRCTCPRRCSPADCPKNRSSDDHMADVGRHLVRFLSLRSAMAAWSRARVLPDRPA